MPAICRIWFLIAWKENLVDFFVRLEKKKRVRLPFAVLFNTCEFQRITSFRIAVTVQQAVCKMKDVHAWKG